MSNASEAAAVVDFAAEKTQETMEKAGSIAENIISQVDTNNIVEALAIVSSKLQEYAIKYGEPAVDLVLQVIRFKALYDIGLLLFFVVALSICINRLYNVMTTEINTQRDEISLTIKGLISGIMGLFFFFASMFSLPALKFSNILAVFSPELAIAYRVINKIVPF